VVQGCQAHLGTHPKQWSSRKRRLQRRAAFEHTGAAAGAICLLVSRSRTIWFSRTGQMQSFRHPIVIGDDVVEVGLAFAPHIWQEDSMLWTSETPFAIQCDDVFVRLGPCHILGKAGQDGRGEESVADAPMFSSRAKVASTFWEARRV